jgi:hypothetical protein
VNGWKVVDGLVVAMLVLLIGWMLLAAFLWVLSVS